MTIPLTDPFTWGTDLSGSMQGAGGVGGLISMTVYSGSNAGTYFYCYDGNGNVTALVNASNGVDAANYEYGPFGEVIRATGPMAKVNPFLFSTKYYDWETGFYYYGYRYYNPNTGKWLSRDPAQEKGGRNLYCFVANDSVDDIDKLGLMTQEQMDAEVNFMNGVLRANPICCNSPEAFVKAHLAAKSWDSPTVTMALYPSLLGGATYNSIKIIGYAWWNCEDAQMEAGSNNVPIAGGGQAAWHDYGWYWGQQTKTETVTGSISGPGDPSHWDWMGGILYLYCDRKLHILQVKLAYTTNGEGIEFDWSNKGKVQGWTNPHNN